MRKKSVALLGVVLSAVLCFGGCGKEQVPVEEQSVVVENSVQVSSETEESSSESEAAKDTAPESESVQESESIEESEVVPESSEAEEAKDAYLEPVKKCLEALVDGNMMKIIDAMPEKYADAFFAGLKAMGKSQEEIEAAFSTEPEEGADKISFRYGEATPKSADEIAQYSAMLNDIAPMDVTEGYSVMVYASKPDGEESGKSFDVYKVDGEWTISIQVLSNTDEEDPEETEEPENEYTLDNFTTLEEYYKIPAVAAAVEKEMAQVRDNFKNVYVDCTFMAIGNVIYYDYYYIEGVQATEENRKKLEEAFPATATQLKSVLDTLETATGIRPEKIVCSYYTYDGAEIYVGEVE